VGNKGETDPVTRIHTTHENSLVFCLRKKKKIKDFGEKSRITGLDWDTRCGRIWRKNKRGRKENSRGWGEDTKKKELTRRDLLTKTA